MNNDIRSLDLNLLKALDALIDEGSVTRAAQRLSLTQPAVSGMLTRLRDYFGDPLFVRAQRGMVPTARARELAAPVKQLLTDISILLKPAHFNPLSAEMTYSIMATDYALKAVIVPLMSALKNAHRVSASPCALLMMNGCFPCWSVAMLTWRWSRLQQHPAIFTDVRCMRKSTFA